MKCEIPEVCLQGFNEENYRPVSVLPVVFKIFERLLQKHINCYIEEFLSPYFCGYMQLQEGLQDPTSFNFTHWKMEN